MSRRGGFSMFSGLHMHIPGLESNQRFVLARMSSFGIFFEDAENTAKFLNFSPKTVQIAKQKLLRCGYIFELENTGRGKKYLVRADIRIHGLSNKDRKTIEQIKKRAAAKGKPLNIPPQFLEKEDAERMFQVYTEEPEEIVEEETPTNPLRPSTSERKPRKTAAEKEAESSTRWRKAHPDLIPIFNRAKQYLDDHQIPLLNFSKFRTDLTRTAKLLSSPKFPEQHIHLLEAYFEYLESDAYLYQLEKNKYAPRITDQYDLWTKIDRVRQFAGDTSRHYDPSKTLTH